MTCLQETEWKDKATEPTKGNKLYHATNSTIQERTVPVISLKKCHK